MPKALLVLILVLSLAARFVNIDGPPVGHHEWRQTDTAGVARAYARAETGFARPLVPWRGDSAGAAETEFPLYAYLAGFLQRATGLHQWVPRALSIAAGLATLALAYLLIRLRSGDDVARWSLAVLAVLPLATFFSRTIQPESWMHCAFVAAVYFMARWSTGGRHAWLAASALAAALAILLKLPSAVVGLPLAVLMLERLGRGALRSPLPWLFALVALAPPALWYLHAHNLGRESGLSFGILGSDKWGSLAPLADPGWYRNVLLGKIAEDHLAIVGAPLVLAGIIMRKRTPREIVFDAWTGAMLMHIMLIPVGHAVHDYYQLPLTVPLAFYIGRFFARARLGPRPVIVRAIAFGAFAIASGWTLARLYREELERPNPQLDLAAALAGATAPDDLVVVIVPAGHACDPTVLYLADRRGWTLTPRQATPKLLADLASRGARAAAVSRQIIRDETDFRAVTNSLPAPRPAPADVLVHRLTAPP